jgi:S1-C subfamily serine protease
LRLAITLRPGNSGGALVNARGQIVGIPHMVTGSGLALAVSSHTVRRFLDGADGERDDGDNLRWV